MWALVVLQVFWFMDELSGRVDPEPWGRAFVATVTFVVLHGVYEVTFLTLNQGQTPGRDLLRIRVVPARGDDVLDARRALRRWVLPGLSALVPPVWAGGLLVAGVTATAAWPRRRRGAADLLAGTVVVHYDRDKEDPTSRRPPGRRPRPRRLEELVNHGDR